MGGLGNNTDQAVEAALSHPPRRSMASVQRLFGGVFLLIMAILLCTVAWWTYRGAVRDGVDAASSFARLAANQSARMVESADLLLIDMQRIGRVADWGSPAIVRVAGEELRFLSSELPHVKRLTVFGPNGRVRASSAPDEERDGRVNAEAFFAFHAGGGDGLYISPLLPGRSAQREIVISRPVTGPRNAFDGIVAVVLDPEAFATFFRSLDIPLRTIFYLVHDDMSIVLREPRSSADLPGAPGEVLHPDLRRHLSPRLSKTAFEFNDAAGRPWLAAAHEVERYPLQVVLGIEHDALTERWIADTLPYLTFGCLALLALSFLVSVSIRQGHREDMFRSALMRSNEMLEHRVQERTRSLEDALEQKDTLFRELNHRVKNNLQIVASLLRLQSARFKDPSVTAGFTSCLGRIQSMSAVHEMLYRKDDVAHVDFRDYLGGLARRLGESYGGADRIRIEVSADDDLLDVRTAVPLALFVNEVVSNSFKHAFPDGRAGTIAIEYRVEGEMRRLTARDDGVGIAAEGAGRPGSLGMQLARALAGQLGGTFRQGPGNPGTITVIEFDLGKVADD